LTFFQVKVIGRNAMKKKATIILLSALLFGCQAHIFEPDVTPPAAPSGLRTLTGDDFIEVFWEHNYEADLSGYHVYVSSSYDGRYELIGTTQDNYFLDGGARNGNLYYYAVAAFDLAGNQSSLSIDVAYDIPRPEGYDVVLTDYRQNPGAAGYDFSAYAIVPYDDLYADFYFENYQGVLYANVRDDTDIQDMGPTASLLEIGVAPADGWSDTHDARLIVGHTYVVWTWDDHYAKFRVTSLSPGRVVFDWAYQLRPSSPLLKRGLAGKRAPHGLNRMH
jgi:hypothetical protein